MKFHVFAITVVNQTYHVPVSFSALDCFLRLNSQKWNYWLKNIFIALNKDYHSDLQIYFNNFMVASNVETFYHAIDLHPKNLEFFLNIC